MYNYYCFFIMLRSFAPKSGYGELRSHVYNSLIISAYMIYFHISVSLFLFSSLLVDIGGAKCRQ